LLALGEVDRNRYGADADPSRSRRDLFEVSLVPREQRKSALASAKAIAVARPRPLVAPVTRATCPASSFTLAAQP
jgi:hypothetical protein